MRWGSQLRSGLIDGLNPVVDLVYPPRCPLCGEALAVQGGLCSDCWSELEVPGDPSCKSCQRPMGGSSSKSDQCFACGSDQPKHSGIHAATIYNDASRQLILLFKHGRKIALAPLLARLIAARLPQVEDHKPPLLIPVPLHRWRLWNRGFNQAALLARELATLGKGELIVDGLVRRKRTPSLGGLGREEREKALSGAIKVRPKARSLVAGRDVILVDDVLTSGATTDACIGALIEAGAATVRIACFARVINGSGMGSGGKLPKSETPEAITAPGAT